MSKVAKVFYPKHIEGHVCYSNFMFREGKDTMDMYPGDGDMERVQAPLVKENFEQVTHVIFPDDTSNHTIFQTIVQKCNGVLADQISRGIEEGRLNAAHSSFSRGDVIGIGGCYYMSDGISFHLMPLGFADPSER